VGLELAGSRETSNRFLAPIGLVRMSTGIELQTMLPVVNAPFRIYYAYNALRLDGSASPPIQILRSMFPCPTCQAGAAGTYTYDLTRADPRLQLHASRTTKGPSVSPWPQRSRSSCQRSAVSFQLPRLVEGRASQGWNGRGAVPPFVIAAGFSGKFLLKADS